MSRSLPSARMRPSFTASAAAVGSCASSVTTLPWMSTRSAVGAAAAAPAARALDRKAARRRMEVLLDRIVFVIGGRGLVRCFGHLHGAEGQGQHYGDGEVHD